MMDTYGEIIFPVSYYDAPRVAMQMVEGTNLRAYFDTIQGKNVLLWQGVQILNGIMGIKIVSVKHEEGDGILEVSCHAQNPQGDNGFGFISQPHTKVKFNKDEDDEDYREKSYSRVKRNACRDLVPHQVFCELLVAACKGGGQAQQSQPRNQQSQQRTQQSKPPQQAQKPLVSEAIKNVRDRVRNTARWAEHAEDPPENAPEYCGILHKLGITTQDCMNEVAAQINIDDTDKWTVAHWEHLEKILRDPVGMEMPIAVQRWKESQEAEEEDIFSGGEDTNRTDPPEVAEEEAPAPEASDEAPNDLENLINEMNGN